MTTKLAGLCRGHDLRPHRRLTKPVVYGVFDNRADLPSALLRREQEQALRQVLEILPRELTGPRVH